MFLFITISGNFSPAHRAALRPWDRGKQDGTPAGVSVASTARQEQLRPGSLDHAVSLLTMCQWAKCEKVETVADARAGMHGRGIGSHGHRSPWRPLDMAPPWCQVATFANFGCCCLLCAVPHLALGTLGGGHAVSCRGIRPLVSWHGRAAEGARSDSRRLLPCGSPTPSRLCSPLGLRVGVPTRLPG